MLQVSAAATVATVQDTVPRTVESCCLPPQTGAASIIRAEPQLLDLEQEVLPMEARVIEVITFCLHNFRR